MLSDAEALSEWGSGFSLSVENAGIQTVGSRDGLTSPVTTQLP